VSIAESIAPAVFAILKLSHVYNKSEIRHQLKVFNSVVLDDPRKTVYKKVNRGSRETDPSQVYNLVEMAGKF
jgi:hypothetical protein